MENKQSTGIDGTVTASCCSKWYLHWAIANQVEQEGKSKAAMVMQI